MSGQLYVSGFFVTDLASPPPSAWLCQGVFARLAFLSSLRVAETNLVAWRMEDDSEVVKAGCRTPLSPRGRGRKAKNATPTPLEALGSGTF